MPNQGAWSGFKYGRAAGALEAAVAVCGSRLRSSNLPSGNGSAAAAKDKDAAGNGPLNYSLRPTAYWLARIDHGRAEATLIALYGLGNSRLTAAPPGAQTGSNKQTPSN